MSWSRRDRPLASLAGVVIDWSQGPSGPWVGGMIEESER